jgi:diguanylate cyclase (GGDEF)-like protein
MYSLYDVLLTQHARQLSPIRCAEATIAQLHGYFEDVVLENNLSALVVESLPYRAQRSPRDRARLRELSKADRRTFFFVHGSDPLTEMIAAMNEPGCPPVGLQRAATDQVDEHFVVIADARFSALLATVRGRVNDRHSDADEVIWTFEPDVVFTALEYLMARASAEHPSQANAFAAAVRTSMPKATSLQLTVSVTTKLAHLLQEQAGREVAINRISTAIRNSLDLDVILQTTVDEVGQALSAGSCALRVEENGTRALIYTYFAPNSDDQAQRQATMLRDLDRYESGMPSGSDPFVQHGEESENGERKLPLAIVPLIFHERCMGSLLVTSDDPGRTWQDNELLLLRTVADQAAVAVTQAHLFAQIQQQALTDSLTGCYNRRSFEMQLDRDLQTASRLSEPVSLLMLDLDRFKEVNDSSGHNAGDDALRLLSECFRYELRGVDSAARFGGDEFALILPQASAEGAIAVGERLRRRIQEIQVPGFGGLSASIGIATFPLHAGSAAELVLAADDALYHAKQTGRNRVCLATMPETNVEEPAILLAARDVSLIG